MIMELNFDHNVMVICLLKKKKKKEVLTLIHLHNKVLTIILRIYDNTSCEHNIIVQ